MDKLAKVIGRLALRFSRKTTSLALTSYYGWGLEKMPKSMKDNR